MDKDFPKSLNLTDVSLPADLYDKVILRLGQERELASWRRRFMFYAASFAVLLVAIIPTGSSFLNDINRSGFSGFLSLLLSDIGAISVYWQDFSLSLLESLPVISTISVLAIILGLLLTLKPMVKYSQAIFFSARPV